MRARLLALLCSALLAGSVAAAEKAPEKTKSKKAAEPELLSDPPPPAAAAPAPGATSVAQSASPASPAAAPAPEAKKDEPAPVSPPAPAVAPATPAVPDAAVDPAVRAVAPGSAARWSSFDAVLADLRITDIVIAFFALVIALFALGSSAGGKRLRALAAAQAEDNRRAVEASERAAEAARRSADAAEQTLAALRETSERQLRAYVTVRQFLQAPVKDDRQNVHGWLLQVAWQNTGATPTKGFRYWAMLREFERAIPDDFEFTPAGLKDFAGGELGSNGTVNSPPLFISREQIARIQDGSRKVLMLGEARYHDMIRDASRETRFCVELVIVNDPGGANGSPFSFSYYPRHNTIT